MMKSTKLCIVFFAVIIGGKLAYAQSGGSGSPNFGNLDILFLVENQERKLFQITTDGIVRSREIKVNLDLDWPDYVFKPNYSLMPLKQVESFISENGHLPNVPSAQEIKEDGISLGEMNRVLVEKVEELTLHLIEQQRLIEAQAKLLEAQQVRLEKLEAKED